MEMVGVSSRSSEARAARCSISVCCNPARWAFNRRVLKPALRAAGLPSGVSFHDLRHTFASLIAADSHPKTLQALLGHRDASR